jgi:hypothetical protein
MKPTKDQLLWMYSAMAKARYFEDTMAAVYMEGKSPKFDIGAGPVPGEMRRTGAVRSRRLRAFTSRGHGDCDPSTASSGDRQRR